MRGKKIFSDLLVGFTAGFILSCVCFVLLPGIFLRCGLFFGALGTAAGIPLALIFEEKTKTRLLKKFFLTLLCVMPITVSIFFSARVADAAASVAAGVLLYRCCGAVVPDKKNVLSSVIYGFAGFAAGVAFSVYMS